MSRIQVALARKDTNLEKLAQQVTRTPALIEELLEGLNAPQARVKYGCEKLLRQVAERKPELVYPHFDAIAKLLDSENSFLKWGAILTVAHLAPADHEGRIEKRFTKFFGPVTGPVMVTAASIVGAAAEIARAKPALTPRIVRQLLKVETAEYQHKGVVSPECRKVVCGQAVTTFDEIFDQISDKKPVLEFVRRQQNSSRPAVRKAASRFLERHAQEANVTAEPSQRHTSRASAGVRRSKSTAGRAPGRAPAAKSRRSRAVA